MGVFSGVMLATLTYKEADGYCGKEISVCVIELQIDGDAWTF